VEGEASFYIIEPDDKETRRLRRKGIKKKKSTKHLKRKRRSSQTDTLYKHYLTVRGPNKGGKENKKRGK